MIADMPASCVTSGEIARAAATLRAGGLAAFPTETVYGLGANALDERAVARVFEVKGRPRFDPLIVHIADTVWLNRIVAEFPPQAAELTRRFWPGPLTLVLPKTDLVPDLVTAGSSCVAVRMPNHPVALELLRQADLPVAAPSANLFGRISPTTAAHVRDQLGDTVDLILEGGPCAVGVESTVVQLAPEGPLLLRPGGITSEELEAVIGPISIPAPSENPARHDAAELLLSPGRLPQHYAPRTPLILADAGDDLAACADSAAASHVAEAAPRSGLRIGLLALRPPDRSERFAQMEILSAAGDLREAASRFFAALRRLDAAGLDLIIAELFPEQGLGRALNDRLRRAATK
jgi:L-threonylcarbamoyladenylate synthase